MAKNKASIPEAPKFQQDERFDQGINRLAGLGEKLTSFDFSGDLSPLQNTIDLDPQITQLALQQAQSSLMPEFNLQRQNTVNELANLGALQSSTASNAFAQQDQNLNSQLQSFVSAAALQDRERALNNRINLFGTGLDTTQTATGLAGESQNQQNNFNLANYQNQVAYALNQENSRGGLFGGLMGSVGGALAGAALAPFTGGLSLAAVGGGGLLGGLAGSLGPSGTGGQLLNTGGMLVASNPFAKAGSTAGADRELTGRNYNTGQSFINNAVLNNPELFYGGLN